MKLKSRKNIKISFKSYITSKCLQMFIVLMLLGFKVNAQSEEFQFFGVPEPVTLMNSPYDENFITLHSDGNTIFFTRRNHPNNPEGSRNPGAIWVLSENSLQVLTGNTNALSIPLGFSANGSILFYSETVLTAGTYTSQLFQAKYTKGSIENTQLLLLPNFRNKAPLLSGSLSFDERHLVFSAEGTTTYGVEDLYVSHLQKDGSWTVPRNLGYQVNTAFQEFTPFLAADNETLFFSSNGRSDGQGSFDIYMSRRLDDTWQNWTEPKNLGNQVNTSGAEMSFCLLPDSEFAYYSSTTDSDGYGDIKKIKIQSDIVPVTIDEKSADQEEMQLISQLDKTNKGLVFILRDIDSRERLKGTIRIYTDTAETNHNSPYWVTHQILSDLKLEGIASGYLTKQMTQTMADLTSEDTLFIDLQGIRVGTIVNLDNVLFHQGTANFIEGSQQELKKVVEMLKEYPDVKIMLKGHTDNQGNAALNLQLSQERVRVVTDFLTANGIYESRVSGKGFGGSQPAFPNDSEQNRRKNRRVEFEIVEN